jgi:hypothetical protein
MTINKPTKIFIGILTALEILIPFFIMPGLMMLITFGPFFSIFTSNAAPRPDMILRSIVPMMMVFYPTLMCFAILQFALQIFYIIHEIKNKALTDNYRIFFAIGTFFLPHITMPIYFIAYLWKDNPPEVKSSTVEAAI